ncbi:MAG: DUF1737 domain-containing protein [Pseudomonadota bacterium]
MHVYRFVTAPDDGSFSHKVTEALNRGWQLYGQPSYAFDAKAGVMRCGQAVMKDVDLDYDAELDLDAL